MNQSLKTHPAKPRCGLCGKTKKLTKTECCGKWICDDEDNYVLFSYARNSCSRNHRRLTLCGFHSGGGHKGHWEDCERCRKSFPAEMYHWYGTNEYNFEKLKNPPHFEPTLCDRCGIVIKLGTDTYSIGPKGTLCERCNYEAHYAPQEAKAKRPAASRKSKLKLPVNPDANTIEVILSAQVQKRWRIKPTVRANEPPRHWVGQWRVDFGQKSDRTGVVLATNTTTLYTFVFSLKELGKGENFETLFRLRLGFALVDAPSFKSWQKAPIIFATGNPRIAIGSMNDMRQHLAWRPKPSTGPMENDEDLINNTPYFSLPTAFPYKEFAQRLTEMKPLHAKHP